MGGADIGQLMGRMAKTQDSLRDMMQILEQAGLPAAAYSLGEASKQIEEAKNRLWTGQKWRRAREAEGYSGS